MTASYPETSGHQAAVTHQTPRSRPTPAKRSRLRAAFQWLGVLAALYISLVFLMVLLEDRLVFRPWGPAGCSQLPRRLPAEHAEFESADGTRLHGWFIEHPQPNAVVLFCHGNAGNVTCHTRHLREMYRRLGVSVLVFDYRGFGRSEGSPSESGVLMDARAARAWLAERTGVTEEEIVLWGESLGGGVAVELAARDGAQALILLNTFTSLPDVGQRTYPWLPVRALMRNQLDSLSKISNYAGPLLVFHAANDQVIPFVQGQRLFEAANDPKRFVRLSGGHNGSWSEPLWESVGQFLGRLPSAWEQATTESSSDDED